MTLRQGRAGLSAIFSVSRQQGEDVLLTTAGHHGFTCQPFFGGGEGMQAKGAEKYDILWVQSRTATPTEL